MIVQDLIAKIHLAYKGKGSSKVPPTNSDKYGMYLSLANDNLQRWAEDPRNEWLSLIRTEQITVDNGIIELPERAVRAIKPLIIDGKPIDMIDIDDRYEVSGGAYTTGPCGKRVLNLAGKDMTRFNGKMANVSYIAYPDELKTPQDEIICDSVRWLAYQTAAQLARNDPAKEDQSDALFDMANDEYIEMSERNRKLSSPSGKRVKSRIIRIAGL